MKTPLILLLTTLASIAGELVPTGGRYQIAHGTFYTRPPNEPVTLKIDTDTGKTWILFSTMGMSNAVPKMGWVPLEDLELATARK